MFSGKMVGGSGGAANTVNMSINIQKNQKIGKNSHFQLSAFFAIFSKSLFFLNHTQYPVDSPFFSIHFSRRRRSLRLFRVDVSLLVSLRGFLSTLHGGKVAAMSRRVLKAAKKGSKTAVLGLFGIVLDVNLSL